MLYNLYVRARDVYDIFVIRRPIPLLNGLNDTLGLLLERTKQSGERFFVVDDLLKVEKSFFG
jgi:hypothetical protein